MKNKKIVSLLLTGAMTAALLAVPAQAADPPPAVRVSSYKGNTLEVGEISGLIIGPSGTEYTANSSTPDVVRVGNVLGRWTATAQAPGTATITFTAPDGETGSVTITVVSADAAVPDKADDSAAYSEVRQELARLVNQARRENGAPELSVSDALMTAAQACSDKLYPYHHNREECEAVAASGYPNGFGSNITAFTGTATADAARQAVENWLNSPGHRDTMLDPDCDCLGVGVTESDKGVTCCYLFIGKPDTINPYG